jgi:hypothetical protein
MTCLRDIIVIKHENQTNYSSKMTVLANAPCIHLGVE